MAVAGKGFLYVAGYGHSTRTFVAVPVKVHTREFGTLPVLSDGVVLLEDVAEMKGLAFTNVLNSEVIDNEGKYNGLPLVKPDAKFCGNLVVAGFMEACDEEVVGKLVSLGKAVDTFANFEIDPAITGFVRRGCIPGKIHWEYWRCGRAHICSGRDGCPGRSC